MDLDEKPRPEPGSDDRTPAEDDASRGVEDEVDEQADDTFPASDPPSW